MGYMRDMSGSRTDPWPASWPPFRRRALHVAVAAGMGSAMLGMGTAVGQMLTRGDSLSGCAMRMLLLAVFGLAAASMIAAVVSTLDGVEERRRLALVASLCVGVLALGLIASMAGILGGSEGGPLVLLSLPAFAASGAMTASFSALVRGCRQRRLTEAFLLGGILIYAGLLWGVGVADAASSLHYLMQHPPLRLPFWP